MKNIGRYTITETLYQAPSYGLYRGMERDTGRIVTLKLLHNDEFAGADFGLINHQVEAIRRIDHPGIVRILEILREKDRITVIFEEVPGVRLKEYLREHRIPVRDCIGYAIDLADILNAIHRQDIIHRNITPSGIYLDTKRRRLIIADFGLRFMATRVAFDLANPDLVENTLPYISPEQTGRMNLKVDYRSDFYSLGSTLYEMLTGAPPFTAGVAQELIHAHIALEPVAPASANPEVPPVLSRMVMKLLSKNPADRYQSSFGLRADFTRCRELLKRDGSIPDFPLGRADVPERFSLPHKLYGRGEARRRLQEMFESARLGTPQFVLISGSSGIGMSSLLVDFHQKVSAENRGYNFLCRCVESKQGIPHGPLAGALERLFAQILTESPDRIELWKERLLAALDGNGDALMEAIPALRHVIGEQPPLTALSAVENENRFNVLCEKCAGLFFEHQVPHCFFIDDLQWADTSTLQFIRNLATGGNHPHLFFLGSCRVEVSPEPHPLTLLLDSIRKSGVPVEEIQLREIPVGEIRAMIADIIARDDGETSELARVTLEKTGGNPLFVGQFLQSLNTDGLITYNYDRGAWEWDIERIKAEHITDNVIQLMTGNISKLPDNTREVLTLGACIGGRFSLRLLEGISGLSQDQTSLGVWDAVQRGILVPVEDVPGNTVLEFLHDRIHQAAYSLIPDGVKKERHVAIGRLLLGKDDAEIPEESLAVVVDQLNRGRDLIVSDAEKLKLAQLNLRAGRKAKGSLAYDRSFAYFQHGIECLEGRGWEREYELTRELFSEAAESAYLSGRLHDMNRLAGEFFQEVRTLLDAVKMYELRIYALISQNELAEAISMGLELLKMLDAGLVPPKRGRDLFSWEVKRWRARVRRKIKEPHGPAPDESPERMAARRVLTVISFAAYARAPQIVPSIIFKMLELTWRRNDTAFSPLAYVSYGALLCSLTRDYENAWRFGKYATDLVNASSDASPFRPPVNILFNNFVRHCREHLAVCLDDLLSAYQGCLAAGNFTYASNALHVYCVSAMLTGMELGDLELQMAVYNNAIRQIRQETNLHYNSIWWQGVINLIGAGDEPWVLAGEVYNEAYMLPLHNASGDLPALRNLYTVKAMLALFFGRHHEAFDALRLLEKLLPGSLTPAYICLYEFFDSLARLALYPELNAQGKRRCLARVAANQRVLKKRAKHAPMNYLHRYFLVEAERARVTRRRRRAERCYDLAVEHAGENGYIHEQAFANELAANFYLERNNPKIARAYLQDAHTLYRQWGAKAKVEDLQRRHGVLIAQRHAAKAGGGISDDLDLATVMRASHAISGEIILEKLLGQMLRIIIENAGAQRGYLILERDNSLYIEAEGSVDDAEMTVLRSIPVTGSDLLPISLINYVKRTHDTVVLNDAAREGLFRENPYVKRHGSKSILCLPLVTQQELKGILFLYNNLITNAFPPERVELIKLLSTQAAVSLENALLFEKMRVAERELQRQYRESQEQYDKLELMNIEIERARINLMDVNEELAIFKRFAENSGQGLVMTNFRGNIAYANSALSRILEEPAIPRDGSANFWKYFSPESSPRIDRDIVPNLTAVREWTGEIVLHTSEGNPVATIQSFFPIADNRGIPLYWASIITDITEIKRLEQQLIQAQKMEAIGRLAGGIAHDFNNFLTAIIGYSELLKSTLEPEDQRAQHVREIIKTAERSASLTRQLLAFSRKQLLNPAILDLNTVILDMKTMLRRLIGENVKLVTELAPELERISADPGQIEQVIMNLVVNSRDALERGGVIIIRTANAGLGEDEARLLPHARPGRFVRISITDNGTGMDEQTVQHIFEPFFSTKESGKGTGLGLSVVYGITAQHKGWIDVTSTLGKGTEFTVWLPAAESQDLPETRSAGIPAGSPGHGERILLVEDQEEVRAFASLALRKEGYAVVECAGMQEALDRFEMDEGVYAMVFSDVVLPDGDGVQLVGRLLDKKPDLAVILCSGYTDRMSQWEQIRDRGYPFLQKPYSLVTLLDLIDGLMSSRRGGEEI